LHKLADRIQARAIQRCGELLKEFDARPINAKEGRSDLLISQEQAATDAGLSERQRKTAVRVADIPKAEFERLVESDDPPTVLKSVRNLNGRDAGQTSA